VGAFRGHPLGAGAALNKKTPAYYLVLWAIMADERLSAAAKCVATVLLLQFRNHKTSICNPSFTTIAQCVGRRRRSVIDAIKELKEPGWMDWEGTAGGRPTNTNNFQFFLKPRPVHQTALVQDTAPVQSSASTGAAERTQPVQYTAHEPSIEPSRTISGAMRLKSIKEGVRIHSDGPYADRCRASIGQPEPAFSKRDGYYIEPLPPLPPEHAESAA
jgi:Helix-turn-helix domain